MLICVRVETDFRTGDERTRAAIHGEGARRDPSGESRAAADVTGVRASRRPSRFVRAFAPQHGGICHRPDRGELSQLFADDHLARRADSVWLGNVDGDIGTHSRTLPHPSARTVRGHAEPQLRRSGERYPASDQSRRKFAVPHLDYGLTGNATTLSPSGQLCEAT